MFQTTVGDLAKDMDVEYPVASSIVKMLVQQKKAKVVGTRPNGTGRGKGSYIYELPTQVTIVLKK
jgi:hypothetical protein